MRFVQTKGVELAGQKAVMIDREVYLLSSVSGGRVLVWIVWLTYANCVQRRNLQIAKDTVTLWPKGTGSGT